MASSPIKYTEAVLIGPLHMKETLNMKQSDKIRSAIGLLSLIIGMYDKETITNATIVF